MTKAVFFLQSWQPKNIEDNSLPVNPQFLFEGEEEIGSPALKTLLEENKGLLNVTLFYL